MTSENAAWQDTLLPLLALATRLEDEGQYNVAKLLRAAADSLSRGAAYRLAWLAGKDALADAVAQAADALTGFDLDKGLLDALKRLFQLKD